MMGQNFSGIPSMKPETHFCPFKRWHANWKTQWSHQETLMPVIKNSRWRLTGCSVVPTSLNSLAGFPHESPLNAEEQHRRRQALVFSGWLNPTQQETRSRICMFPCWISVSMDSRNQRKKNPRTKTCGQGETGVNKPKRWSFFCIFAFVPARKVFKRKFPVEVYWSLVFTIFVFQNKCLIIKSNNNVDKKVLQICEETVLIQLPLPCRWRCKWWPALFVNGLEASLTQNDRCS